MEKINTVKKGQGDWHLPLNALIELANKVGGVEVTHLADPLIWVNGCNGRSEATVIKVFGLKIVFLSISHFDASKAPNGKVVAQLPDDLAVDEDAGGCVRMTASEKSVLAIQESTNLYTWFNTNDIANQYSLYGSAWYLAKNK